MADQVTRRLAFGGLAVNMAALLFMGTAKPALGQQAPDHSAHFLKCAKMCTDCQIQCDSCFAHCKDLVTQGKKEYASTMELCVDCGECCKLAAALSARKSPLAADACECCMKACNQCAAACEKYPNDQHMADCAKSCRACAASCKEMVQHLKH
jgi:hypothetical protein